MKKFKLNLILLIILVPLLTFCGGVRDALEGKKRSEQSDEFLVKKKNPLQMPPDMNKLPKPGDDLEASSQSNDEEVKDFNKGYFSIKFLNFMKLLSFFLFNCLFLLLKFL